MGDLETITPILPFYRAAGPEPIARSTLRYGRPRRISTDDHACLLPHEHLTRHNASLGRGPAHLHITPQVSPTRLKATSY